MLRARKQRPTETTQSTVNYLKPTLCTEPKKRDSVQTHGEVEGTWRPAHHFEQKLGEAKVCTQFYFSSWLQENTPEDTGLSSEAHTCL